MLHEKYFVGVCYTHPAAYITKNPVRKPFLIRFAYPLLVSDRSFAPFHVKQSVLTVKERRGYQREVVVIPQTVKACDFAAL